MEKYIGVKMISAEKCPAWKDAGGHKIDPAAVELHYNCAPHTLSEQDFVLLRD